MLRHNPQLSRLRRGRGSLLLLGGYLILALMIQGCTLFFDTSPGPEPRDVRADPDAGNAESDASPEQPDAGQGGDESD